MTIGTGVTVLPEAMLHTCSELTTVTIHGQVTEIKSYAFTDCAKLGAITIPTSVTKIGTSFFFGCKALKKLEIPNISLDMQNKVIESGTTNLKDFILNLISNS